MLKYGGGRNRGQMPRLALEQNVEIALVDLVKAGGPGQAHLFWADINSCRVISIH